MSQETRQWLSENTLIGFTDKRGNAWHYREGDLNHYPDAIPVGHVEKRLFDWEALEQPLFIPGSLEPIPNHKAIVRSDNDHVMGIFRPGYQPHQYRQWLLANVSNILDDDLQIGSAGLLRQGAVAWVSVEVPENITTPEGVVFRPFLLATTSFDGSVATTYKRVVTNVVCDNTMNAALREGGSSHGETFKVRHSSKSLGRLTDARDALGIVHGIADDFAAQVAELSAVSVPDAAFDRIVKDLVPLPEPKTKDGRANPGLKRAASKRDVIWRLWRHDDRVAPWSGNAFGAWQAFNTYMQHEMDVRGGAARAERNMQRVVDGEIEKADAEVVDRILALAV
ncbi:DUF932 domain-containing protein [Streptomyces griseus]|uniref:DUF932 domain-containing protein n=1 Tax=Streptomyces griseus TaxID=1911 RepID=UPI0033EEA7AD